MSIQTAQKVASKMLGMPVPSFDQLAASAIAELGNMISGTSMTNMSQLGLVCDITPPTIIRGSNVRITTLDVPAIVVPLRLGDTGTIEMNVSLQERAANKAA